MWLGEHGMLDIPDEPGQETTGATKDESAADLPITLPPETATENVTADGEATATVTTAE